MMILSEIKAILKIFLYLIDSKIPRIYSAVITIMPIKTIRVSLVKLSIEIIVAVLRKQVTIVNVFVYHEGVLSRLEKDLKLINRIPLIKTKSRNSTKVGHSLAT